MDSDTTGPVVCPVCMSRRIVPIIFGYPTDEAEQARESRRGGPAATAARTRARRLDTFLALQYWRAGYYSPGFALDLVRQADWRAR